MSIANTQAETIINAGIIDDNDQVLARVEHLRELETLVGNVYPNKFERTNISGAEDTISNVLIYKPVAEIAAEFEAHKSRLNEGEKPDQELKAQLNEKLKAFGNVRVSGRLAVPPRVMGKAAFVHLSDGVNRLQIYVRKQDAKVYSNDSGATIEDENAAWDVFKLLDHGDFIGAEGFLFLTNTGELSVHVETFQFLSKALMPMPDKMHEIGDAEISRRYRYVDLIASSLRNKTDEELEEEKRTGQKKLTTREVFERRAKLISGMRRFLDDAGYIEVETPMLTPKATGAAATPFETHHNALDIPLYARIAPELYLKRLTVGGFEKVYELNRNFRNEGLSHKHNPEFTMLEFYCAYMDVNGMMDFAEAMIKESVQKATGGRLQVKYGENEIDFSKFERLTMKQAISKYWSNEWENIENDNFEEQWLENLPQMRRLVAFGILMKWGVKPQSFGGGQIDVEKTFQRMDKVFVSDENRNKFWDFSKLFESSIPDENEFELYKIRPQAKFILTTTFQKDNTEDNLMASYTQNLFEDFVEDKVGITEIEDDEKIEEETLKKLAKRIVQPTFIIDYPKSISPLSKASPENPQIAERFELFINGMECANGFSELNDPQEQYERFVDQSKEREGGDHEAMVLDEDYIRALAYGMPPAAGIGIGIDRLVMLLTDKHSIRDVILFPHMRPVVKDEEKGSGGEEEKQPVNPS